MISFSFFLFLIYIVCSFLKKEGHFSGYNVRSEANDCLIMVLCSYQFGVSFELIYYDHQWLPLYHVSSINFLGRGPCLPHMLYFNHILHFSSFFCLFSFPCFNTLPTSSLINYLSMVFLVLLYIFYSVVTSMHLSFSVT